MTSRAVISGIGSVSGLGVGVGAFWEGLTRGATGLGTIRGFDAAGLPSSLGAEVADLPVKDAVPKSYRKAVKVMARDSELAVVAAQLAALDAGVRTRGSGETGAFTTGAGAFEIDGDRSGCQIGAGLVAAETRELSAALSTSVGADGRFSYERWGTEDGGEGAMMNLPPLWMLKYLPNMLACHVTIIHGLRGPSNTITCAEASGLLSVGEASRVIERGDADLCFAGGAESKVNPMGMMRLWLSGRLAATDGVTPEDAWRLVRPFDPASAGALAGEAGSIFVIESAPHAARRGATVYAEIAGFGAGQSPAGLGASVRSGLPGGGEAEPDKGLLRAVRAALRDAGIGAGEVDAIVPAGLGVPTLDAAEAGVLRSVMGARLAEVPLICVTPAVGLGAAGHSAMQLAAAACAVRDQRLPARRHAGRPAAGLLASAAEAGAASLRHVLVCVGAHGGPAAAMVLRRTNG